MNKNIECGDCNYKGIAQTNGVAQWCPKCQRNGSIKKILESNDREIPSAGWVTNKKLKELWLKSTPVVGWYAHFDEVRGPFGRWLTASKNESEVKKGNLAHHTDDIEYAAAAMSTVPRLLKEIEQLKEHYAASIEMVKDLRKQLKLKDEK